MMAPITPWLATLVETELENVIAWKSIVKPDPSESDEHRTRFSDDGSNLRSVVGPPSLDSDSTIQLLEVSALTRTVTKLIVADYFTETRLKCSSEDTNFRWRCFDIGHSQRQCMGCVRQGS
jgi:hypothetical protein